VNGRELLAALLFHVVGDPQALARRVVHLARGLLSCLQFRDALLDAAGSSSWIWFSRSAISCFVTLRVSS